MNSHSYSLLFEAHETVDRLLMQQKLIAALDDEDLNRERSFLETVQESLEAHLSQITDQLSLSEEDQPLTAKMNSYLELKEESEHKNLEIQTCFRPKRLVRPFRKKQKATIN